MNAAGLTAAVASARAVLAGEEVTGATTADEIGAADARVQAATTSLAQQLEDVIPPGEGPEHGLWQLASELRLLERELLERSRMHRVDALERVEDGLRRLGDLASVSAILGRAVEELGAASRFDRLILSTVDEGLVVPKAAWRRSSGRAADVLHALHDRPMRLRYPLVEAELVTTPASVMRVDVVGGRVDRWWADRLGWTSYAVGRVLLAGKAVALVHGDATASSREGADLDLEVLAAFVDGLGPVIERAALRERLRLHRAELLSAVQWMTARLAGPGDSGPFTAMGGPGAPRAGPGGGSGSPELADVLTRREVDVLRLMGGGHTNKAIGRRLVLSEGTVKYHVKNILRKLNATNRADAVARYERLGASSAAGR